MEVFPKKTGCLCSYPTSISEDEATIKNQSSSPREKIAARLLKIEKSIYCGQSLSSKFPICGEDFDEKFWERPRHLWDWLKICFDDCLSRSKARDSWIAEILLQDAGKISLSTKSFIVLDYPSILFFGFCLRSYYCIDVLWSIAYRFKPYSFSFSFLGEMITKQCYNPNLEFNLDRSHFELTKYWCRTGHSSLGQINIITIIVLLSK